MSAAREARAYRRLFGDNPSQSFHRTTEFPTLLMELSGPSLGHAKPVVTWKFMHGVWFFTSWQHPLYRLDQWGDTKYAFARLCNHLNYSFHWLSVASPEYPAPDIAYPSISLPFAESGANPSQDRPSPLSEPSRGCTKASLGTRLGTPQSLTAGRITRNPPAALYTQPASAPPLIENSAALGV